MRGEPVLYKPGKHAGKTRRHSAGRDAGGTGRRNGAWPGYKETWSGSSNEQQKETQLTASPATPNSYLSQPGLASPAMPSERTSSSGTGALRHMA